MLVPVLQLLIACTGTGLRGGGADGAALGDGRGGATTEALSDGDVADAFTVWIELPEPHQGFCGDNRYDPGEHCDDGNAVGVDGCSSTCRVEMGWECPQFGEPCNLVVPAYACGNGLLAPDEVCDDGNTASGDGCAESCRSIEPGWYCRVPGRPCHRVCDTGAACGDGGGLPVCGDGIVEPGEECDGNNDGAYGGCTAACTYGPHCGDGIVNGGEECDDGPANRDIHGAPGCTFACTAASYCGDGIVDREFGERCDDGKENGRGSCTPSCSVFLGS